MSPVYADGEVPGGEVLNLAVIAAAMFVILAAIWQPAAPEAAQAAVHPAQQVVVAGPPPHAS
jgi:hypothetical protein